MSAREVAAALGGACRSGAWWRCRCPVHSSRSATLALRDGERGMIVKCFADCDPRDILAELRRMGLIVGRSGDGPPLPALRSSARDHTTPRMALARRIWDAAQDVGGTPVVHYLAGRRLTIAPPPSLRWSPRCWHREARAWLPAMVARVDNIDGEPIGVHRTYLARDDRGQWRRRDRATLGPIAGGAVRLALAAETLLVGEGLETCLASMLATARPAWAALSTSGIMALALPAIVRDVVILADHDSSGAGERAARQAAERWLGEGRRVTLALPPEPGTDFNDVLLGRAHAHITEAHDAAA
jgi:putative DNA primase/helicase